MTSLCHNPYSNLSNYVSWKAAQFTVCTLTWLESASWCLSHVLFALYSCQRIIPCNVCSTNEIWLNLLPWVSCMSIQTQAYYMDFPIPYFTKRNVHASFCVIIMPMTATPAVVHSAWLSKHAWHSSIMTKSGMLPNYFYIYYSWSRVSCIGIYVEQRLTKMFAKRVWLWDGQH